MLSIMSCFDLSQHVIGKQTGMTKMTESHLHSMGLCHSVTVMDYSGECKIVFILTSVLSKRMMPTE